MTTPSYPKSIRSKHVVNDQVLLAAQGIGFQGRYGAITEIADRFGVSRQTVYAKAGKAREILEDAFRSRYEFKLYTTVEVDRAQLERAIISSYVEGPNSMRDVQALVKSFYGIHVGYGTIFNIIDEAETRAAAHNRSVDLKRIKVAALDELFSQGSPVFTGIDLDTGFVFMNKVHEGRSGKDWSEALAAKKEQGLSLETVVKDAGKGLAAGVSEAFPAAVHRDDTFHLLQKMLKVRCQEEKRGWGAMNALIEAEDALQKAKERGGPCRKEAQRHWRAREKFEKIAWRHDAFELLAEEVRDSMEFVDMESGELRSGAEQREKLESLAAQMRELGGRKIRQVSTYLKNRAPGLSEYIDELGGQLVEVAEREGREVVECCCQLWRCAKEHSRKSSCRRCHYRDTAVELVERIITIGGERAEVISREVFAIIETRHRASSAVEGFNSLLRPHLYVHKRVSQGFLELFTAWRNLRVRPMGKHKGTSAHELVTGENVTDWLSVLGYPPKTLRH